ncbi:MAG: thiamine phosphate synthase [bacterium]
MKTDFKLFLVTDRKLVPARGLVEAVAAAVKGGVDAVVLREKNLGGRELYELGKALQEKIKGRAELMINDRLDVALALNAGVHLPGSGLAAGDARRLMGPEGLVGVSTHHIHEVRQAESEGADYVFFGPVYETGSKKEFGGPQGLSKLQQAAVSTSLPVFAVGGVNPERARQCLAQGARGVAFISFVLSDPDPEEAALRMKDAVSG